MSELFNIELININEADVVTLTEISGIGEALAARIVEYRETVHPFEEIIELSGRSWHFRTDGAHSLKRQVTVAPVNDEPAAEVEEVPRD